MKVYVGRDWTMLIMRRGKPAPCWRVTIAWGFDPNAPENCIPWKHVWGFRITTPVKFCWLYDGITDAPALGIVSAARWTGRIRRLLYIKYWTPRGWYIHGFESSLPVGFFASLPT